MKIDRRDTHTGCAVQEKKMEALSASLLRGLNGDGGPALFTLHLRKREPRREGKKTCVFNIQQLLSVLSKKNLGGRFNSLFKSTICYVNSALLSFESTR